MSTICATATAPGGALGVIRISGDNAIEIADTVFSRDILNAKANSVIYGHILDKGNKAVIDEVMLSVYRAPHSYTGENSVELTCHGSSFIMKEIISLLCKNGCRIAQPGEFTKRAFLNGKMDLTQAEAVADLIASQNKAQHNVAMTQLRGGITTKLHQLRDKLLNLTSLLELELDFSEEDVEFADRKELTGLTMDIQKEIQRLSDSFQQGNSIKNGIPVAIIGAPNVGKSTLLNALLKDDKAIVSDIQGTTRDTIEDTINIQGYLFRFIDTAGIRKTDDVIEKKGIERTLKAAEKAQIIILLTEKGIPFPIFTPTENQTVFHVINKSDKEADVLESISLSDIEIPEDGIYISALHEKGIDTLLQHIIDTVSADASSEQDIIITNERHKIALDQALINLDRALNSMLNGFPGDIIAEDLRLCLDNLADIIGGHISNSEVLGNIFSRFCIGK